MMTGRGVIALDRGIWTDPDFVKQPLTQREAFLWMVCEAAFKDHPARGIRGPVELKRGEFCHSLTFMAEAWRWKRSRVDRFIQTLKNRDMLRDTSRDGEKIYFVKNYNKYQKGGQRKRDANRDGNRDAIGTLSGRDRDELEKKDSSFPNGKAESASPPNIKDRIWSDGLSYLTSATGNAPGTIRGFLGKQCKTFGDRTVLLALMETQKDSRADPRAFLVDACRRLQASGVSPNQGDDEIYRGVV